MKTQLNTVSKIVITLSVLGLASTAFAANENRSETKLSSRVAKKFGATAAVGLPAPGIFGVSVNYNIKDYLRANAGFGQVKVTTGLSLSNSGLTATESSATTLGFGVTGLMPGWKLSPALGLNYGYVSMSDGMSIGGFNQSGGHVYGTLGLDYQGDSGFNFGTGITQSLRSGVGTGFYLSAGWFFDLFG